MIERVRVTALSPARPDSGERDQFDLARDGVTCDDTVRNHGGPQKSARIQNTHNADIDILALVQLVQGTIWALHQVELAAVGCEARRKGVN